MSDFLVNLLPTEARQVSATPLRRRALWLTVCLLGFLTFGLCIHSFASARRAAAELEVAQALRDSAQQIGDLRDALTAERDALAATEAIHRAVALAVEPSDIVATISHLIPKDVTLESLKLQPVEQKAPGKGSKAKPKAEPKPGANSETANASDSKAKAKADAAAAIHPAAVECTLNGLAPNDKSVHAFAEALAAMPPFTSVSITGQQVNSADGTHHFTLTFTADPYAAPRKESPKLAGSRP